MSQPAAAPNTVLLEKAREWFREAVANEASRRGGAKLVEQSDIQATQHVVMHHLSGAVPNGANMAEPELRSRLQKMAAGAVAQLVGDRKGEVLVVSSYPARISVIAGHIQYDWHAGAAAPGEIQHKMDYPQQD